MNFQVYFKMLIFFFVVVVENSELKEQALTKGSVWILFGSGMDENSSERHYSDNWDIKIGSQY